MDIIKIYRTDKEEKQTLGQAYIEDYNGKRYFEFKTLELPFIRNEPEISCVTAGIYPLILEHSSRFNRLLYELYNVPGRAETKLHSANFVRQLRGCIAPGIKHIDIDGDGLKDVTNSNDILEEIMTMFKFKKYLLVDIK